MLENMIRSVLLGSALAGLLAVGSAASAQAPANGTPAVPPAVLKAFKEAYPGATIAAALPQRDGDRSAIRLDSLDKGRRRVVLYDLTGKVLEVSEQVDERELPAPVAAAIRAHRRAIYVTGLKVTRGGGVEYHLTVKGSRRTAMIAKPDGTVVSFK
jgi:hypothetical protein